MQGLFLFYTLAVLLCVFIADLLTAVLDPRTREA
jgi:ABC-type dipeptide/oligopeptide/nickel transport system permease component